MAFLSCGNGTSGGTLEVKYLADLRTSYQQDTFDIRSQLTNYSSLTSNNFFIIPSAVQGFTDGSTITDGSVYIQYTASSGMVLVNKGYRAANVAVITAGKLYYRSDVF